MGWSENCISRRKGYTLVWIGIYFFIFFYMSDFSQFTRKYSLSKTLRFELKPAKETTKKLLEENKVFQNDKNKKLKYIQTKSFFDQLHRDFIKESFQNVEFSRLSDFYENWKLYKKDKKTNEKLYKKSVENLRKEAVSFLDANWKNWAQKYKSTGLKKDNIEILFEEGIFNILDLRYGDDIGSKITDTETWELISIFHGWKGFTGYFTKFFETRRNFYKTDGTGTAVATRIVDQNLARYLENLELFERIKDKIDLEDVKRIFPDFAKIGTIENYNTCILQEGIDSYNRVLGWYIKENGEKIKGINESINLYRQAHKDEKIPFFRSLDKQIGSEKVVFLETIDTPEEFRKMFEEFVSKSTEKVTLLKNCLNNFFLSESFDWIFLSKESLNTIAHKWIDAGNMKLFHESLFVILKKEGAKHDTKEDEYHFPDFVRVSDIKKSLSDIATESFFWKNRYLYEKAENPNGFLTLDDSLWVGFIQIFSYEFSSLFERIEKDDEWQNIQCGYNISNLNIRKLLEDSGYNSNDEENKKLIKSFADDVLRVYQMGKYFAIEKKRQWNPDNLEIGEFYSHPEIGYDIFYTDSYKIIVQGYNDIRNYLTKNPWSEEKWKLNFENSNLATGWPDSPEGNTQYCTFIFRKEGRHYLWITDFSKILDSERSSQAYVINWDYYEKMVYKQVDAKTLYWSVYKWLFGTKYSDDQLKLWDQELIQRIRKVLETRVHIFDEFTDIIKKIDLHFFNTAKDLAKMISDGSFYKISFVKISSDFLEKWVYDFWKKNGENKQKILYLFEISNQDFSSWKTGQKNLHTLYFEHIFSKENREANFPLKLNGQAELFFRPASIKAQWEKRKFSREIVAKKRYTEDKIFFHVPFTLNRTQWNIYGFNAEINNFLAHNPDINILGIDRGEKHLAYYSIIDQKGNIIESDSLNTVNGVNYGEKLADTAEKRKQARQDWQAVEGIKNLKKGYISAVVHKLTDLIIEHNAIVVFEDLNMRFKQIRGWIEKSVYQQLEKDLINKLNYLVIKWEMNPERAGHLLNAYQLTDPFTSFQEMGKQTGIIFYTQASHTSKIDPVTGWRPHLYLKYSSAEQAKKEIKKFTSILWNPQNKSFDISYDIKNFSTQKEYPSNTCWTVCSCVERYRWDKTMNQNMWGYIYYSSLTPEFERLFTEYHIDIHGDIREQITYLDSKGNEKFFKSFLFLFSLICQIRNTNKADPDENRQDFILSPVTPFFDTRDQRNRERWLPRNGDENGAYNIARKWLIILGKINRYNEENKNCDTLGWKHLSISQGEWDNYTKK